MPRRTFPLVARRPVAGLPFGSLRSRRRGPGLDLAGLRPYRPGDDVRRIDRHASARRSSLTGGDELVVREHLTEEGAWVVVLVDAGPTMTAAPDGPWLSKPEAAEAAVRAIDESARRARCPVEVVREGEPEDALARLAVRRPPLRAGSFVFCVSDFLRPPVDSAWEPLLARRLDVVPVVVQDPIWEQSFPVTVAGVVVPFADPRTGRVVQARLTRAEAEAKRREHEERLAALEERFRSLGLDRVLLSSADPDEIAQAFVEWSIARQTGARVR